ncbi:hypothetical protein YC2023_057445 [Brassica napus]
MHCSYNLNQSPSYFQIIDVGLSCDPFDCVTNVGRSESDPGQGGAAFSLMTGSLVCSMHGCVLVDYKSTWNLADRSPEKANYLKHVIKADGVLGSRIKVDPKLKFENSKLRQAYIALQSWKLAILSDPFNFTANWNGSDLGLLRDLALFHLNSNRFCGEVPLTFNRMKLLYELDLSNNRFVGKFPNVVLSLPSLKFLDLCFNEFEGKIPSKLFDRKLDAIFLNHNRFPFGIPENMGNSPVSALVLADNDLGGCIPGSIGQMGKTLNELIFSNDNLTGCLPQIGNLKKVTVFDVSSNRLRGPLPSSVGNMRSLEELHVANNGFTGVIPPSICQLPNLENFTYSSNFFTGRAPICGAVSV